MPAAVKPARVFSSVQEFVDFSEGVRAITKVLIANNGIGAVKAIRSIRRWAYEMFGDERAIQFVVMATPEDMRANAEYIRMGDEIVDVPGGSNINNYANVMLIVEIAERYYVDAVWAGWGHASENPVLPNTLATTQRKIVFIGPAGAPMQALGDKIGSTIIAQSAGVPTIAWNGDGITVNYEVEGIPDEVYQRANVTTANEALEAAHRIGFPVMIKASAGGGGKGIRKVTNPDDLPAAFRQVQGEIPGSPIFVMKVAKKSRHLEVQLIADEYGNAIALNGRDCSVQRRHQKIIEEGPPVAAPMNVWREMERAAVSLAKTVGYSNAGTVEYLYSVEDQAFFFLELNPRLQVEHPVTEMITKVNLPAAQLQVAMGLPLYRIPDIRKMYGRHPFGKDTIDFETSERLPPVGHCIAVRVTAENPDQGFQPTSGTIQELNFRSTPDVWGYFSINASGVVHEFADSQFGHLFAAGTDRESARKNMVLALKELSIRGDIRTTVEYIVKMMQSEDFVENRIDTTWLDQRIVMHNEIRQEHTLDPVLVSLTGAAILGFQESVRSSEAFVDMLSKGQIPPESSLPSSSELEIIYENIKYKYQCALSAPNTMTLHCNNSYAQADIRPLSDGGFLVTVKGKSRCVYVKHEAYGHRLIFEGQTCVFTKDYDPTTLVAEVAGKLARTLVLDGTHLNAGSAYAEIEVMKMFMPLTVKESGTLHWKLSEGATLSPGDIIATLDLDDPSCVKKAEAFLGDITSYQHIPHNESRLHIRLRTAVSKLQLLLQGYYIPTVEYQSAFADFESAIADPKLPLSEYEEALGVLNGRLNPELYSQLQGIAQSYRETVEQGVDNDSTCIFPASTILPLLHTYGLSLSERDRAAFLTLVNSLWCVCEAYLHSVDTRSLGILAQFVEMFINVERRFDGQPYTDAVDAFRRVRAPGEFHDVLVSVRSHNAIKDKTAFMVRVLGLIERIYKRGTDFAGQVDIPLRSSKPEAVTLETLMPLLSECANLKDLANSQVSLAASKIMFDQNCISHERRRERIASVLQAALETGDPPGTGRRVEIFSQFVQENLTLKDLLPELLCSPDPNMKIAVIELYVRKIYKKTHHITDVSCGVDNVVWYKFAFTTRSAEALPSGVRPNSSFVDLASLTRKSANDEPSSSTSDTANSLSLRSELSRTRSDSEDDSSAHPLANVPRVGVFSCCETFEQLQDEFANIVCRIDKPVSEGDHKKLGPVNAVHIVILKRPSGIDQDSALSAHLASFLQPFENVLSSRGVRRVTVFVNAEDRTEVVGSSRINKRLPAILTFRARLGFTEDVLLRHIEPPHAFHLDLLRLRNFDIALSDAITSYTGNVHIYQATPKTPNPRIPLQDQKRFFARLVTFTADAKSSDMERLFVESLEELTLMVTSEEARHATSSTSRAVDTLNHIFVCICAPDTVVEPGFFETELKRMVNRYADKLARVRVHSMEVKLTIRLSEDTEPVAIRLVTSNPTGYVLRIDSYVEVQRDNSVVFRSIGGKAGEWDGRPVSHPYDVSGPFDSKRAQALASSDTLFCFDYLDLFERAVELAWEEYVSARPNSRIVVPDELFTAVELCVCRVGEDPSHGPTSASAWSIADLLHVELREIFRPRGCNDVGMVAWLLTLKTPEYPQGRTCVCIANDITFMHGSFGTKEDVVFYLASRYARERGLPRLYIAANSGARIGLAESLKKKFKVAWTNMEDPSLGFRYIYLSSEEYNAIEDKSIVTVSKVFEESEERYMITDIIGEEPDLGVENLAGSGLIAGETSLAYNQTFTLTIVAGRSVGIGAYLVRLGQRTIQKTRQAPIILTGYQALNKLMGREIYTSNEQLGGPMIMYSNGVSHAVATTHVELLTQALKWMSYVPSARGGYLPVLDITGIDMVERPVQFTPEKGVQYDPRHLVGGCVCELDGTWVSGFFDKFSFTESHAGWARTVVTGRARLGGLPVGVIVTENRTAQATVPADPADVTSHEKHTQQAGGVWFPDSAFKTAQALRDFNGEELPCFVFANWRGFSGGQQDMFDEVLKFGAQIVDALVAYKQPLFVYIPPFAELRGGAWVVVDSTINKDVMEFYCANNARGGVLEPNGAASIKFREKDLRDAAHRLDPQLQRMDNELKSCAVETRQELKRSISEREHQLLGVYEQIAVHFADLHDTPGRMCAKGVCRDMVQWAQSRSYFYWRLRRRLAEFDMAATLRKFNSQLSNREALLKIRDWFVACQTQVQPHTSADEVSKLWDDDKRMLQWFRENENSYRAMIISVQEEYMAQQTSKLIREGGQAFVNGLKKTINGLNSVQAQQLRSMLQSL